MTNQTQTQGKRVLLMGSIMQLFLGILYVWSIFTIPVTEYWGKDLSLTSSFMLCCFVLGILTGGKIQLKLGASKIVLTGGLMLAVGMLLTSFVPLSLPYQIYLTYGILGGFGVGMGYNAIISCAQKWFPNKRGLATGIAVSTFGFSTVLFAPLIEALVKAMGVLNTFRTLALIFCIATLILHRFIYFPADVAGGAAAATSISEQKQYTTSEMLKTKQYYMIAGSMMLFTAAFFILNPSFKTFAIERNLDAQIGTIIVQITGVANAAGRLVIPILADKIGREKATFSIILATTIFTSTLSFATGALFICSIAVVAFCFGASSGVYPLLTSEYFGLKNVGSNYGMVMVAFMLSAMLFPILIGGFSNEVKFVILATMAAVSGVLIILLGLSKKKMIRS